MTCGDLAQSTLFLPFLRGSHQSREFVIVEPPHGKKVERKVCTERGADIQVMTMHATVLISISEQNAALSDAPAAVSTNADILIFTW